MVGYEIITTNGSLYHHGVMGMKWGVRRFGRSDGTLTRAGRRRYGAKDINSISSAKGIQRRLNDLDTAEGYNKRAEKEIQRKYGRYEKKYMARAKKLAKKYKLPDTSTPYSAMTKSEAERARSVLNNDKKLKKIIQKTNRLDPSYRSTQNTHKKYITESSKLIDRSKEMGYNHSNEFRLKSADRVKDVFNPYSASDSTYIGVHHKVVDASKKKKR